MGMSLNDVPRLGREGYVSEDGCTIPRNSNMHKHSKRERLALNALFSLPTTSMLLPKCFDVFDAFDVFDVLDVFDTLSSKKVLFWKLCFWTQPSDHRPHFPMAHCLGFRRAWRVPKGSALSPQHTKSSTRWAMATWHGGNELRLQTCSQHGMWNNGYKMVQSFGGEWR